MSITLLYEEQPPQQAGAKADGENLWFTLDELHGTTGWGLKFRGVCLGDVCVPISAGRESEFLRADDTEFNLAALARSRVRKGSLLFATVDMRRGFSVSRKGYGAMRSPRFKRRTLRCSIWIENRIPCPTIGAKNPVILMGLVVRGSF